MTTPTTPQFYAAHVAHLADRYAVHHRACLDAGAPPEFTGVIRAALVDLTVLRGLVATRPGWPLVAAYCRHAAATYRLTGNRGGLRGDARDAAHLAGDMFDDLAVRAGDIGVERELVPA